LKSLQISHIVSLGYEFQPKFQPHGIAYHIITIEDDEDANLLDHLPEALDFVSNAVESQMNVLVHCVAGVSRSAAVVVAYLMKSKSILLLEAKALLEAARPTVWYV
jgi:dual specificity phosphatase 12